MHYDMKGWVRFTAAAILVSFGIWFLIGRMASGAERLLAPYCREAVWRLYSRIGVLHIATIKDQLRSYAKFDRSKWWVGDDLQWLCAGIYVYWGLDCAKISMESIEVGPETITVRLPETQIIAWKIDLGSREILVRQSLLRKILDGLVRDNPGKDVWADFEKYTESQIAPSPPAREQVLARLQGISETLGCRLGKKILLL